MIVTILICYSAILAVLSYRRRGWANYDDYLMAKHSLGAFPVAASLFTLIGGGELVTLTALSFLFGYAGLALFIGFALSFGFIGFFFFFILFE